MDRRMIAALIAVFAVAIGATISACTASGTPSASTTSEANSPTASPAETTPVSDPTPDDPITPPPPNEFESRVIAVLTSIGVDSPGVLEHGFQSATVGGAFETRFAHVYSFGPGTPQDPRDYKVVSEITLTGEVPATVISTPVVGETIRFVCTGVGYHVASLNANLDPGSSDLAKAKRLANLMTEHLNCT